MSVRVCECDKYFSLLKIKIHPDVSCGVCGVCNDPEPQYIEKLEWHLVHEHIHTLYAL